MPQYLALIHSDIELQFSAWVKLLIPYVFFLLLSEESCKLQVWGAPREQLTQSGLVLVTDLSIRVQVTVNSPLLLFAALWLVQTDHVTWILPCDWLAGCHKACDWMIVEIYIRVSKLPLWWFYFCSNIMTDVAICKRNNFPKLLFQGNL